MESEQRERQHRRRNEKKMTSLPLQDDDEENDIDEAKMLLIGENGIDNESLSPAALRDGAQELQQYNIRSIESTVVIRQLTSQGLSFQLWPAASTFVTLLDNYRRDPSSSPLTATLSLFKKSSPLNILELGSGTGVVGIAAAVTLSANVTVTDLPHVLDNLNFNAEANAEVVARFGGEVHVEPLRWGEADDVEVLGRNVDLILASDVVYHDHLYEPLLETLRLMQLEGKKLIFLMAHLRRWKKESVFFKKARKLFHVEVIHSDVPQQGSRIGVVVYRFATKQPNQNGRLVSS
ncbi:PREDICTED: protein N-lysine methyltransferase METTL21A-like isoform X2 [Camelina sativa]|uniref:Protein N-lysine methyltransferase METTL21A-like isoform X2 n=1 Tax=Camelina sativa TaxID=90675 RepID=A0ABM0W3U8_CAMSA|nr:PREDICTED: protein N-lysine methyltransferase METTL21A-like isoform X2 [Camelina sativa]